MNLFTFNFKNFFFALTFTTFTLVFTTIIMIEYKLQNEHQRDKQEDFPVNANIETLAFGDSRVERGLVSSSYFHNFGRRSYNIENIKKQIMATFTKKDINIKNVILQADPHMFSFYRLVNYSNSETKKNEIVNQFRIFKFLEPENRIYLIEYSKSAWKKLLFKNEVKIVERKFIDWDKKALIRVQLHNPLDNFIETNSFKNYIEILDFLKSKNINVCLVTFPVSQNYNNYAAQFKNFEKVKSSFKNFALSDNVDYIDVSSKLNNDKFTDSDHIKSNFSIKLTKIIGKKCRFKLTE